MKRYDECLYDKSKSSLIINTFIIVELSFNENRMIQQNISIIISLKKNQTQVSWPFYGPNKKEMSIKPSKRLISRVRNVN